MIRHYTRFINLVSWWFNNISAFVIFILMLLVVSNIVLRQILGRPIIATYDLVEFLMAFAIGFSLAYCAVKDGHIYIGLFMERFPRAIQKIVDLSMGMIAIVFFSIIAWFMGQYAHNMHLQGEVSLTIGTPLSPFIYLTALGVGLLSLAILGKLLSLWGENR